ncbi:MAG: PadR family transcriptional regulator [Oscillospiraceae bacterium]|jgi:PadR family transcriptional regulator PadR|nr:PadR family transcriptional regulator [Oscillospiraceae bacterium]
MVSSDLLRGHLETILLRLIGETDRYGYELFSEIDGRAGGRLVVKEATLYAVLQRLERQGYITSYQGDVSGGSKRRYYHMTPLGKANLEQGIREWHEAQEIINIFLRGNIQ